MEVRVVLGKVSEYGSARKRLVRKLALRKL